MLIGDMEKHVNGPTSSNDLPSLWMSSSYDCTLVDLLRKLEHDLPAEHQWLI